MKLRWPDWFRRVILQDETRPFVADETVAQIVMKFVPLQDFFSPLMKSMYVQGLLYQVRRGNVQLTNAVNEWVLEGKVKIVPLEYTRKQKTLEVKHSTIEGKGWVE